MNDSVLSRVWRPRLAVLSRVWRPRLASTGILWLALVSLTGCGRGPLERSLPQRTLRGGWLVKNEQSDVLSSATQQAVAQMKALGIRWIALGPTVTMPDIHRPAMIYGSDDEAFRRFVRWARQQGLQIMLMPRIESEAFFRPPFPFRADIQMLTSDHWDQFFANYKAMLLHYGRLCEEEGVGLFAVGLEYLIAVERYPERWRAMIRAVREVYKGKLTYSANWHREYEAVTFWDELDLIGIGAYFELDVPPEANVATLRAQWNPIVTKLTALANQYNKPILFTEVGYTSFHDAARMPWKWQQDLDRPLSHDHQADCFDAMFAALAPQPWFAGVFLWRFYTAPSLLPAYDYNPIGKPSASIIQQWFKGGGSK